MVKKFRLSMSPAKKATMNSAALRRNQHGAVAIEFAVLFSIFFAVLYAIIAYSIPLLLMLTFKQVAADAARATIAVDPAFENYQTNLETQVKAKINESWIANTGWYAPCPDTEGKYSKLGATGRSLTVCIRYINPDYSTNPIIPALTLPAMGQVPRLPQLIEGTSTIRL